MMIAILVVWIPWSILNAVIASEKGRSGVGIFFLSLFFTPLAGSLYVLAVPALSMKRGEPIEETPIRELMTKGQVFLMLGCIIGIISVLWLGIVLTN